MCELSELTYSKQLCLAHQQVLTSNTSYLVTTTYLHHRSHVRSSAPPTPPAFLIYSLSTAPFRPAHTMLSGGEGVSPAFPTPSTVPGTQQALNTSLLMNGRGGPKFAP